MPYFSHFNNAIVDLEKLRSMYSGLGVHRMMDETITRLIESEKFYQPSDIQFLSGKEYTDEIKTKIKLPFDKVAIMHYFHGLPCLTIAQQYNNTTITFFSALKTATDGWSFAPHFSKIYLSYIHNAITIGISKINEDGTFTDENNKDVAEYYRYCMEQIIDLCVMLTLHNVKTSRIVAPKLLKRIHKKKNFYDYHVLNVNGDLWDRPIEKDTKNHHYFRSHMRRGHIRRLQTGKNVWVSACFVKGNIEGYVGKEYQISR